MLSQVQLRSDVLWTCLSHALSTEHQEIMGLCLGRLITPSESETIALVERSIVLSRKDKKKDRVEVSYDHLAMASTVAESLSQVDDSETRVIGWYHSHPHITVLPSHVDVKTQGQYQALGDFLGLIFSVFDKGRLEICAFQSRQNGPGDWERVEIPIVVISNLTPEIKSLVPPVITKRMLEGLTALQIVLLNEEKECFESRIAPSAVVHNGVDSVSDLDILRQSSVYQAALYRLIDNQLFPLLHSIKSKIESLQREKQHLLDTLGEPIAAEVNSTPDHNGSTVCNNSVNADKALDALLMMVPKWRRSCSALQRALGGFEGSIVASTDAALMPDTQEPVVFTVKRAVLHPSVGESMISSRASSVDCSPSPWSLEFVSVTTPLVAVQPSIEPGCVQLVLALSDPLAAEAANGMDTKAARKAVTITVKLCGATTDGGDDVSTANLLGANLHRALGLHLLEASRNNTTTTYVGGFLATDSDSMLVDLSLTQR